MRTVITGLVIQIEITKYNSDNKKLGQLVGNDGKPPVFAAPEAEIPEVVLEWVRQKAGLKEADGG